MDLNVLFKANPGVFAEEARRNALEELFKREQSQRAQEQLNIQREQNARLDRRDAERIALDKQRFDFTRTQWDEEAPARQLTRDIKQGELANLPLQAEERKARIAQLSAQEQRKKAEGLADVLGQAGSVANINPQAAKKLLVDSGFEELWAPGFDTLQPENLSKILSQLSNRIIAQSQAYQTKQLAAQTAADTRLQVVGEQQAGADRRNDADNRTRLTEQDRRIAAQREIEKVKSSTKGAAGGRENLNQQIARYNEMLRTETDDIKRAEIQIAAAQAMAALQSLGAQPSENMVLRNEGGKVVMGNPTPRANPFVSPSTGSPAQDRQVRIQLPDGRTGTIPASKLQDAIGRGAKEIK